MKRTTIFVVALTVFSTIFLESSASPAPSLLGGIFGIAAHAVKDVGVVVDDVLDSLIGQSENDKAKSATVDQTRKMIYERIEISNTRLAEVTEANKEAWANAGPEFKDGLTETTDFLDYLNTVVPAIHDKLKGVVNGGSEASCKEVLDEMKTVIEKIKTFLANLKELPADFKAILEKGLQTIMNNASDASSVVKCKADAKTKCALDDQKCKMIYERIEISNTRLAEVTEANKEAWANAGPEFKDGLTETTDFLDYLNTVVPAIHDTLKGVVNGGSEASCKEVLDEMKTVIEKIKTFLANLKELPADFKAILEKGLRTIMNNASDASSVVKCKADAKTKCALDDQKCKMIYERIEISNTRLAEVTEANKEAWANAGPEFKDGLTETTDFLDYLNTVVPAIHDKLKGVVNGGSEASCKEVLDEMKTVIEKIKTFLANLKELPADFKAILEKGLRTIMNNASDASSVIKCKADAKTKCALDDQKCKMIYERMEMSEKCLADVNIDMEKALVNAGDEHKEGLTELSDFLKNFNSLVPVIHGKIKKVCNGGSQVSDKEVIAEIKAAVANTKTFMANAKLIPANLKAAIDKGIGCCIVTNAVEVYNVMECKANGNDDLKQKIEEKIKANVEALEEAKKYNANASGDEKAQKKVQTFLKELEELSLVLIEKFNKVVSNKCLEGRDEFVKELNAVNKQTQATLDSFTDIPEEDKKCLDKYIGIMINNCHDVIEILNNAVDACDVPESKENGVDDDLKQEIKERIAATGEALEEAKKCLAKATDEEQDQLTQAKDLLNFLDELFPTIVNKLEILIDSKSLEGRDELVIEMHTASKDTEAKLDNLEAIPEVKECLDKYIKIMIANCNYVADKISKL